MKNSDMIKIEAPSLPEGGGSLKGMGESLSAAGPDGVVSFSLPLPVSSGRGVAPELALSYSSAAGNGAFGLGWRCDPGFISLRTAKGVPQYDGDDTFLGPNGDVLVAVCDAQGKPERRTTGTLLQTPLGQLYTVSRWQSRIVDEQMRLEYWQPQNSNNHQSFWVVFSPDGQVSLFGYHPNACIADPDDSSHIACWLMEEVVTPTGEHVYYSWEGENNDGCDKNELAQHPQATAQRYLTKVSYGNIEPESAFMCIKSGKMADNEWLFHLVFDYGERTDSLLTAPTFHDAGAKWTCRPDCFSRYEYGFEIRTRRMCHQVLTFHDLSTLNGEEATDEPPALISRMILDYDLSPRGSLLLSAQNLAHETDGTPLYLAPLEFEYQRFETQLNTEWQKMPQLEKFNGFQPYQLVDLFGEGIPGVLYQDTSKAWLYREPLRDTEAINPDSVTYGEPKPLPTIPMQQDYAILMDINGDGILDWVISSAGARGYHAMSPQREWTTFVPFNTLPLEYFHPQAQFSDVCGAGLPDITLVGPRSVRVWRNNRQGWDEFREVKQIDDTPLPIPGRDERVVVAFSDVDGSGRSHLVKVSAEGVQYWPNLGRGLFGEPKKMSGFDIKDEPFEPDRLYMADTDGSGTTDLIYAKRYYLELFINESGNHFASPLRIDFPDGVRFDDTCRLQIADTQGLGVGSIVLTVPHMDVRHWRLDIVHQKPGLLNEINNNMGADTQLCYRSSAQYWLDQKLAASKSGKTISCHLPFAVHLLHKTTKQDEITGNRLVSIQDYAHGVWDGQEREYCGFARLTQRDYDESASGTARSNDKQSSASCSISWYVTGNSRVDDGLSQEFWKDDIQAFDGFETRYTYYDSNLDDDIAFTPNEEQLYWLNRAARGIALRSEVYGEDGSSNASVPYNVSESRIQARIINKDSNNTPVVWPSIIETRSYNYERVINDPLCAQSIIIKNDAFGNATDVLNIHYPRRDEISQSPYPASLPETLYSSTYDDQQQTLHLVRKRLHLETIVDDDKWVMALPSASRSDAINLSKTQVPVTGITLEECQRKSEIFLPSGDDTYLGHEKVYYLQAKNIISFPPLVEYIETAEFTSSSLTAFDGVFTKDEIKEKLLQAGWKNVLTPFSEDNSTEVWASLHDYTDYADKTGFFRPLRSRSTLLTGKTTLEWDKHKCVVISEQGPTGETASAIYDYRFLTAYAITDANDNVLYATFDCLGRVTSTRFWGTEAGEKTGYRQPAEETTPFKIPLTIEDALAHEPGIPVNGYMVYQPLNWMLQTDDSSEENENEITSETRHIGRLKCKRTNQNIYNQLAKNTKTTPPCLLCVTTDRYEYDPEQMQFYSISFDDGFGRNLQSCSLYEAGEAYCLDDNGTLVTDEKGNLVEKFSENRWVVSGKIEYNGKGLPTYQYRPYYLNSWKYVMDDSARQDLISDENVYDPLGRVCQHINADGTFSRVLITPWFKVEEDENDTALEMEYNEVKS